MGSAGQATPQTPAPATTKFSVLKSCPGQATPQTSAPATSHYLAEIIRGVKFKDGEKLIERAA